MTFILAVQFDSRLLWAVLIGWIISVVLHEFAHGLAAHLGGDYTIRERGGLSLNPLHYVHPFFSLILPAIILLVGGVPLPGGATYVRRDLLRSRLWETAVSLSGPVMNGLLFLACALPLHPRLGWVDPSAPGEWTDAQVFLGAIAILQFMAMFLNLVPIPPLDGFGAIAPYLPERWTTMAMTPHVSLALFLVYFAAISQIIRPILRLLMIVLNALGFGSTAGGLFDAYMQAFWGR